MQCKLAVAWIIIYTMIEKDDAVLYTHTDRRLNAVSFKMAY